MTSKQLQAIGLLIQETNEATENVEKARIAVENAASDLRQLRKRLSDMAMDLLNEGNA